MLKQGKKLLPPACLAMLMLFSWPALAGAEAVFSVDSATGSAGDTVTVSVRISGVGSLDGVEGISGGEFELVYDPAFASPVRPTTQGDLIEDFIFIFNVFYTDDSIKAVFASSNQLIREDGVIATFTFELKKSGTMQPLLKNLKLFDQDVRPLVVGQPDPPPGESDDPGGENGDSKAGSGQSAVIIIHPAATASPPAGGDGSPENGSDPGPGEPGEEETETVGSPEDPPEHAAPGEGARDGRGFPLWLPAVVFVVLAAAGAFIYHYRKQKADNA